MKLTRKNKKALPQISARLKQFEGLESKAGWFDTSRYSDGTPVAYVAAIQNYGYPKGGIPPRPFMQPTANRDRNKWIRIVSDGTKAVLAGKATAFEVMDGLGAFAAGGIAKTIAGITTPELKRATILARLRKRKDKTITRSLSKPLVDSAIMVDTVTHVTDKK